MTKEAPSRTPLFRASWKSSVVLGKPATLRYFLVPSAV